MVFCTEDTRLNSQLTQNCVYVFVYIYNKFKKFSQWNKFPVMVVVICVQCCKRNGTALSSHTMCFCVGKRWHMRTHALVNYATHYRQFYSAVCNSLTDRLFPLQLIFTKQMVLKYHIALSTFGPVLMSWRYLRIALMYGISHEFWRRIRNVRTERVVQRVQDVEYTKYAFLSFYDPELQLVCGFLYVNHTVL